MAGMMNVKKLATAPAARELIFVERRRGVDRLSRPLDIGLRRIADPDLAVRVKPDDPLARPFEPARDRNRRVGGNVARHHQLRVSYRVAKAMPRLPIGRDAPDPERIMPADLVPIGSAHV